MSCSHSRAMSTAVSFVIFILATSIIQGNTLYCDDAIDLTTGVCGQLFKDLERALLRDEGNLFRMRRLFFHSPTASPVLIKVDYNVTYGENLTTAAAEKEISFCFSQTLNSSMINLEQANVTLGWTSSGIYTIFHPTMLSVMQAQSPFAFLRIIHHTLANQTSPEANTFLWDGSYELPSLHLNLYIQSLTCIPSRELLESLLMDLNTLLKLYGGQEEILGIPKYPEFIGYTLPATSVTSRIIPISNSGVIISNLYSITLCFLYLVIICFLTAYYYHSDTLKKRVDDLINKNTDLSKGIRITTNTAIVIEFTARLVSCIVWTLNIDNFSGVILAVWMPQIHLLTVIVVQNSFANIYICLQENKDKEKSKMSCKDRYANSELRIFSNMCASAFALFYALNPAIILTFAYPAQTIVIYTSVTAYLFATSIFSASIIKLNRGLTKDNQLSDKKDQKSIPECNQDINKGDKQPVQWTKISVKILIFIILWLIVVYLHFLLVLTSYLLLIGKSSVINSTPSFIISLVPSILISGGAWFAKKVAFETEVENEQIEDENVDTPNGNEQSMT